MESPSGECVSELRGAEPLFPGPVSSKDTLGLFHTSKRHLINHSGDNDDIKMFIVRLMLLSIPILKGLICVSQAITISDII